MRKVIGILAVLILNQLTTFSQTVIQGEANKEPSNLAINVGLKQWYLDAPDKMLNSFFVGIGKMPSVESPVFYEVNLHFIPSFNFSYKNKDDGRSFTGDTRATQAGNVNFGILVAKRKSKAKVHPMFGLGSTINFKPGYNSISPSYIESDLQIDNNGLSIGFHPFTGGIYRVSKQVFLLAKVGWSVQSNKNQYDLKAYNIYDTHLFSEISLKFNFLK
ncbi:hypothetical protein [Gynurincola endophyticus]|jgi:hypothetical protein|uniref:hypothetical protein n=1 Tax=Gynurincola endophyticus TaxID=2479004 RepID=UPI000F8E0411|nr:hypothetical protein [Gynurincola endophyticus]